VMYTNFGSLKGSPERVDESGDPDPNHGRWEEQRRRESEFKDGDPTVLIVGVGQSGLERARLKTP
jgi:hypothetical protein